MDPAAIEKLIEDGIPDATVSVSSDDNTHFQAVVVSDAFAGLRAPARHQLIYKCLGERMGNEIHALSIRALTPGESHGSGPAR
jgi:acid stress-induced BolA-like protein IbaG/YrbA